MSYNIPHPALITDTTKMFSSLPDEELKPRMELIDSPLSPTPQPIPFNKEPNVSFHWPDQVKTYLKTLQDTCGFTHRPRPVCNRYFYMNGNNAHLGKEQYEVFSLRLPAHPNNNNNIASADNAPNQVQELPNYTTFFKALQQYPIFTNDNKLNDQQNIATNDIDFSDNGEDGNTTVNTTQPIAQNESSSEQQESTNIPKLPKYHNHSVFPTKNDQATIFAVIHFGQFSSGHPIVVHGGAVSTFLDSTMYELILECNRIGFTANLNINYRSPTPCHDIIFAVGSVELTGPRKSAVRMALFSKDFETLYCEATALFVTPQQWVNVTPEEYSVENMIPNYIKDKQEKDAAEKQ